MRKKTVLFTGFAACLLISAVVIISEQLNRDDSFESKAYVNYNYETSYITITEDEAYILMKDNCYVCHNPNAKSHDEIIAPPFKGVKMRYSKEYENKEDFVNAIVEWVQNPIEDNALMYGAVMQFRVMPKLEIEKKDLEQIANYIYDNDVEMPEWAGNHQNEKQGKGNGKGQGQGHGKGKGKGKNSFKY